MADQSNWSIGGPDLAVIESPVPMSILRVHRDDAEAAAALAKVFNQAWPTTPNVVVDAALRVACTAPGEWTIFVSADQVATRVAQACAARLHHLSDVSAGRRLWRIDGALSRRLLAKGCSIDTHPQVFGAGLCAQTNFAQIFILLLAKGTRSSFDIVADASVAGHLRAWFAEAALEFQP